MDKLSRCVNGICNFIMGQSPPITVSKSNPKPVKRVEVRPTKYLLDEPTYIDKDKLSRIEEYKKIKETELTRLEAQKEKKKLEIEKQIETEFPNFIPKISAYYESDATPDGYEKEYEFHFGQQTFVGFKNIKTYDRDKRIKELNENLLSPFMSNESEILNKISFAKLVILLINNKYREAQELLFEPTTFFDKQYKHMPFPSEFSSTIQKYVFSENFKVFVRNKYVELLKPKDLPQSEKDEIDRINQVLPNRTFFHFERYLLLDIVDFTTSSLRDKIQKLRSDMISAVIDHIMTNKLGQTLGGTRIKHFRSKTKRNFKTIRSSNRRTKRKASRKSRKH